MPGEPAWLAAIPTGQAFVVPVAVAVVVIAVLRRLADRSAIARRGFSVLHGIEAGFVALMLATMLVLSFLQILLRNLAQSGFVWIDPLLRHLLLWIGFAGGALATRLDRHINVDALTRFLPPSVKRLLALVANAFAAFVCLLLADATLRMVRSEAEAHTTGFLDVPTWKLQVVMPIACLVMCGRFIGHALRLTPVERPSAPHPTLEQPT